jgi:hypothetical protein
MHIRDVVHINTVPSSITQKHIDQFMIRGCIKCIRCGLTKLHATTTTTTTTTSTTTTTTATTTTTTTTSTTTTTTTADIHEIKVIHDMLNLKNLQEGETVMFYGTKQMKYVTPHIDIYKDRINECKVKNATILVGDGCGFDQMIKQLLLTFEYPPDKINPGFAHKQFDENNTRMKMAAIADWGVICLKYPGSEQIQYIQTILKKQIHYTEESVITSGINSWLKCPTRKFNWYL